MSLNTTFTKDDGTEVVIPFNGTQNNDQGEESTELTQPDELEAPETIPRHQGTIARRRAPEEESGKTRAEKLILKSSSTIFSEFLDNLLHSDEFEVRRCSNGQVLSQGRCNTPAAVTNGFADNGALNEELQKALKDRDVARAENEKLHANYSALFAAFNQTRDAANDIRMEYEDAREKLKMAATECEEWQAKFLNVKDNANAELERASVEYDHLVRTHDENTKGLRVRVRKMELDLASSKEENRVLTNRVQELSTICDQLLNDVDISDAMSVVSTDA